MNSTVGNPEIGQWYERVDSGELFQVTGIDASTGTIEIQGADGNIDEIEADAWAALALQFGEAPEDWEAMDEMEAPSGDVTPELIQPNLG